MSSAPHLSLPPNASVGFLPTSVGRTAKHPTIALKPGHPVSPAHLHIHEVTVSIPPPPFHLYDQSTILPPLPLDFSVTASWVFIPLGGFPPLQSSRPEYHSQGELGETALRKPGLPCTQPEGFWPIHQHLLSQEPHPTSFPYPPCPARYSPPAS